jgi:hypothetical protein
VAQLLQVIGGEWSKPGKMPCPSWSIDSAHCKVGGVLAKIPGTVCHKCYTFGRRYQFPSVKLAMARRLAAFDADPIGWAAAQVVLMERRKLDRFRWFDSGDLQSVQMYQCIAGIAALTPLVAHWLPTREDAALSRGPDPTPNLCVRRSAACVGDLIDIGLPSSSVNCPGGFDCPATFTTDKTKRTCAAHNCVACWLPAVRRVNYLQH